jgi:hypothetical protein
MTDVCRQLTLAPTSHPAYHPKSWTLFQRIPMMLLVIRAPLGLLWAEESRVLPSQKSTFAPVGECLWTDKDSSRPVMVGILQGGEAIFCHMFRLSSRHSDITQDPNSSSRRRSWSGRSGSPRASLGAGELFVS